MLQGEIVILAGSTRPIRRAPAIAAWVAEIGRDVTGCSCEVVDLAKLGLSLDDEPGIPARGVYTRESTRRWSEQVAAAKAVVFVSPQYNWGYPAGLKNAIDHLYVEWRDKPGLIVTYGGHGGGRCAEQLKQVLEALKMRLAPTMPGLVLPRPRIEADDGSLDLGEFAASREDVEQAFRELAALIV